MTAKRFLLAGQPVPLRTTRDVELEIGTSYSGSVTRLPVRVMRGRESGPAVFVTGAVHGDELNGTGIVQQILLHPPFKLQRGTLVLVPVVNMPGFERHSRYLPDRRDLNRSFPGTGEGSMASRLANTVFEEIVGRCDYGIDLHSAAVRRTNFPNVRADLKDPEVRRLAESFGTSLVVQGTGPRGSLRRAACDAGVPTISLEAGEVWKIEPLVLEIGVRGVTNVLIELGMVSQEPQRPIYQTRADRTSWIRSNFGGLLRFHVTPGDPVDAGQALATVHNLLGGEQGVIEAAVSGVILGMTTLPSVTPGDPVCHIAATRRKPASIREALARASGESLVERVQDDLASSIAVSEPEDEAAGQDRAR